METNASEEFQQTCDKLNNSVLNDLVQEADRLQDDLTALHRLRQDHINILNNVELRIQITTVRLQYNKELNTTVADKLKIAAEAKGAIDATKDNCIKSHSLPPIRH